MHNHVLLSNHLFLFVVQVLQKNRGGQSVDVKNTTRVLFSV